MSGACIRLGIHPKPPLPPPKMLFFRVSCACPRVRSIGWWVHLGVKVGGIHLFPRPSPQDAPPPRNFKSTERKSSKSLAGCPFRAFRVAWFSVFMPPSCRCVRIHQGLGGNRTKSHTGYSLYNFGANRGIRLSPPVIFSLFSRIAVIHDGLRLGVPANISCGPPGCLAGWMDRGASRPPSSPLPFCGAQRPEQRKPRETPR